MAHIKEIEVCITFQVGLANLDVSDQVFKQLKEIHEQGEQVHGDGSEFPEASEWLKKNLSESSAHSWCAEIEYFSDSDDNEDLEILF